MRIFLLTVFTALSFSQGFDWQNSTRLPYIIPEFYYGVSFSYGTSEATGDFSVDRNGDFCCEYNNGTGSNFDLSLTANYWIIAKLKLIAGLSFNQFSSEHSKNLQIPQSDGTILLIQYNSDITNSLIGVDLGADYRILKKLNLGLTFGLNYNLSTTVIGNSLIVDSQIGKLGSIELTNTELDATNFILDYNIVLSYDIGLNEPNYITPFISIGRNVNSFANSGELFYNSVNIGFVFQRGLRF